MGDALGETWPSGGEPCLTKVRDDDAAAAAAFLGLVWPRLKDNKVLALAAALVAVVGSLFLPAGVPVLLTVLVALVPRRSK
jgi:predicted branched-subunit amino acid permease